MQRSLILACHPLYLQRWYFATFTSNEQIHFRLSICKKCFPYKLLKIPAIDRTCSDENNSGDSTFVYNHADFQFNQRSLWKILSYKEYYGADRSLDREKAEFKARLRIIVMPFSRTRYVYKTTPPLHYPRKLPKNQNTLLLNYSIWTKNWTCWIRSINNQSILQTG